MIQNFILFSIVLGTSLFSFAKVTNVTVLDSTASKFEMTAGTTSGAANVYTIFGGNAGAIGGCTTPTSGSVCNSCTGTGAPTTYCTTAPKACAERSIYPTLKLGIQLTMDTIPTNPAIRIEVGSSTATITADSGSSTSFAANQAFTVYIPWSALCDDNAACMTPTKKTLTVGLVDASSSTAFAAGNSQVFTVKIRGVDGATATTNTPTKEPTATQAVTDFSVFPGDGKVFINDIYRGAEGPGDASDIKWQAVRVFYDEFTGNPNYCSIPVDSAGFADLYFTDKTKAETSLGQSYLEGLTNDVPYMFTVATVDEASVVSQFLQIEPPSGQEATYAAQYTATPGEVVGLLDKKKCFIATAAFGSPMEPQVELLRNFRDQVLGKFYLGKQFIRFYYKNSPPVAEFIAQHDSLRAIVRGILWPIVLFADVSIQWGVWVAFAMYAAALGLMTVFIVRIRQRRKS